MHKDAKFFENHPNPVLLVFIEKFSLSTLRWVPMCQGFSHFSGFLHNFVLAKLATSSISVKAHFENVFLEINFEWVFLICEIFKG